ncbi:uncharacterized protein LOC135838071 isoform X2 [Planococcus citri]|uniref:uncharacterized protein LOC135838071 isoform X2 n=1 Tax=Planococcus citri TaxID=170843 RepID=UPI0031F9C3DC
MKRRILFSVVSALLVYYISFQPVSGNDGSPSAETETGILEPFLRKIGCGGKDILELTLFELGRVQQFFENKVREEKKRTLEEKKQRLFYQSKINIADWVESLFVKCWPGWAGARIPKQYPTEYWTILLLNIENQKILNLKMQLKKLEISNEFFVNTVEYFLKLGNLQADLQAYKLMTNNEKKEAIKLLNEQYQEDGKPKVMKILMLGLNEQFSTTNDEKEIRELQTNVMADTEKQRNSLRVLYFPKCKSPLCKEDAVKLQLRNAANAFKMANYGNNEGVINPLAVVATTNGTFVLFESFKDAYSIWCTRHEMEFAIDEMDGIRIIDANELALFEVKENEPSHLVVKVESKSGKNNGSPSAETETRILEPFLRKIGCGGKTLDKLTPFQLRQVHEFFESKVREEKKRTLEEKKLRLLYQSTINIAEWVESLFAECWPSWAGARIPKHYPKEYWTILLLNIENQKILNLKMQLKKLEISNEFFFETVEDLLKFRYLGAHPEMLLDEEEEAIKLLNEEYHADEKPKVIKILMLGLNEPLLTTMDEKEICELQTSVKADTEKQRNSLRVLYFPKCKSPLCEEVAVELQLKNAANAYKMANDDNNEEVINPLAVVATTNGTFVLFESFKDAYSIWCTRNKMHFAIGEMDGIRIIDANELCLFEAKENEPSYLVVKVESKLGKTIADTYDVISNKDFNNPPLESLIQRSAGSQSEENGKISVLYCYGHAIKALSTYGKLKKTIDKSANNVTLTCIPTNQTLNMRILNDEEVTKLKQQQ